MKTVLSIAGTDPTGGAGMQADIKTAAANGVYAMSAVTALVVQNTMGVREFTCVTPEFMSHQLDAVFEDIFPDAVKIGMTANPCLVRVIAERLRYYRAKNIVVDPVMVATAGSSLTTDDAVDAMTRELLPQATLATPNIQEAEVLSGMKLCTTADMKHAAEKISQDFGCAVLLKGGHRICDAVDVLYADGHVRYFEGQRIDNPNTHGTGCTLSTAIAANLAKGFALEEEICRAKRYIEGALGAMLKLGHGSGPLMHSFDLTGEFSMEASDEEH